MLLEIKRSIFRRPRLRQENREREVGEEIKRSGVSKNQRRLAAQVTQKQSRGTGQGHGKQNGSGRRRRREKKIKNKEQIYRKQSHESSPANSSRSCLEFMVGLRFLMRRASRMRRLVQSRSRPNTCTLKEAPQDNLWE